MGILSPSAMAQFHRRCGELIFGIITGVFQSAFLHINLVFDHRYISQSTERFLPVIIRRFIGSEVKHYIWVPVVQVIEPPSAFFNLSYWRWSGFGPISLRLQRLTMPLTLESQLQCDCKCRYGRHGWAASPRILASGKQRSCNFWNTPTPPRENPRSWSSMFLIAKWSASFFVMRGGMHEARSCSLPVSPGDACAVRSYWKKIRPKPLHGY